jgi:hypothetical protein
MRGVLVSHGHGLDRLPFEKHLREVYAWLGGKPHVRALRLQYHDVLRDPKDVGEKLAQFLGIKLNLEAMLQQVDATLYRNRGR